MNPDPPEHTKVSELLDQYSEQVRYGEITDLETAAQQFMDEANAILAADKRPLQGQRRLSRIIRVRRSP